LECWCYSWKQTKQFMHYLRNKLLQACALRVYTTSINESLSLRAQWNLHALVLHSTQVLRHTNRGPSVVHGYPEREGIYKVYWDVGWKHDWKVVHLGLTQRQQNENRIKKDKLLTWAVPSPYPGGMNPSCSRWRSALSMRIWDTWNWNNVQNGSALSLRYLDTFLKIRQEPLYEIMFNTNCKRLHKIACLLH
jgi:hypothetical protein